MLLPASDCMEVVSLSRQQKITHEAAQEYVSRYSDLHVACYNSSENVTLAGSNDVIRKLAQEMPDKIKILPVNTPYHTPIMECIKKEFLSRISTAMQTKEEHEKNGIKYYSSVTKGLYSGQVDPNYWWENLRGTVYFAQAAEEIMKKYGTNIAFVELAASSILMSCIKQIGKASQVPSMDCILLGIREKDDRTSALKGIIQLHNIGVQVNWKSITKEAAQYVRLPHNPWQRKYYRLESTMFYERRTGTEDKSFLGTGGQISIKDQIYLEDYVLDDMCLFSAAASVEYMVEVVGPKSVLQNIQFNETPRLQRSSENTLSDLEYLYIGAKVVGSKIYLLERDEKHVIASASLERGSLGVARHSIDEVKEKCTELLESQQFYKMLSNLGLCYGRSFRLLENISIGKSMACAEILNVNVNNHESSPTGVLDASFQLVMAALPTIVPLSATRIGTLQFKALDLKANENLFVFARIKETTIADETIADIYIFDGKGVPVVQSTEVHFNPIRQSRIEAQPRSPGDNWDLVITEPTPSTKDGCWQSMSDIYNELADTRKKMREMWNINYKRTQHKQTRDLNFKAKTPRPIRSDEVRIEPKFFFKTGNLYQCTGVISEMGDVTNEFRLKDEVLAVACGGVSSSIEINMKDVLAKPDYLSLEDSCWFNLVYATAYHALIDMAEAEEGNLIILETDGNPLSWALLRIANDIGAKVICTSAGDNISNAINRIESIGVDLIISCVDQTSPLLDYLKDGGTYCQVTLQESNMEEFIFPCQAQVVYVNTADFIVRNRERFREVLPLVSRIMENDSISFDSYQEMAQRKHFFQKTRIQSMYLIELRG